MAIDTPHATPPAAPNAPRRAAVVIGSGGIGSAIADALHARGTEVLLIGRQREIRIDYTQPDSVAQAAAQAAAWLADTADGAARELRHLLVCTGFLHGPQGQPERAWSQLDADYLAHSFAVNAIGPALVMRHFLPLMPRSGRALAAFVSARVGSIGDNRLGGWYGYRAAKAALNQLVHTAAIEWARRNPQAICVAIHPGTVDTALSQPFAKAGLQVRPPQQAAAEILSVLDALGPGDSGGFFDQRGAVVPW